MQRAFLPIVLASLGLVLIQWATTMPLFEWRIKEIRKDFPENYTVHVDPTPWISKLGQSLDSDSYIFKKVRVLIDRNVCMNTDGLNIAIERSSSDKALESISAGFSPTVPWLIYGAWIAIILSGIYLWWITIWREHRPFSYAVLATAIVAVISIGLLGILRVRNPALAIDYFLESYDCHGTVVLDGELRKIHYEMPSVMALGILGQVGAVGIMLHQSVIAIIQKKSLKD